MVLYKSSRYTDRHLAEQDHVMVGLDEKVSKDACGVGVVEASTVYVCSFSHVPTLFVMIRRCCRLISSMVP